MKAILVIDKPKDCFTCELGGSKVCIGGCPLRPLPQKLKLRIQREWITDYDRYEIGYNACLDKIAGETE